MNNDKNKILLPEGVLLGHAENDYTGVSVLLCPEGMIGGIDVRGCAPGTRESDLLRPEKAIEEVNAVALCGGSAYGLEACSGVMQYLQEKNCGHKVGPLVVPLVAGAVIFDLNHGYYFPDKSMGFSACENAKNSPLNFGKTGVGKGATIGKILGPMGTCSGGIGAATISMGDAFITAISVVNALGDVIDYKMGKIIAGARYPDGNFVDTQDFLASGKAAQLFAGNNTTLCCVITNIKLSKLQANKLASVSHNGLALSIRPVHTDYDGDTIFALSKGEKILDFTTLSCMAVEAVAQSVKNAVTT